MLPVDTTALQTGLTMAADPNAVATLASGGLSTLPIDPNIAALATTALPATLPIDPTALASATG